MKGIDIQGNRKDNLLEDALSDSFFEFREKPVVKKEPGKEQKKEPKGPVKILWVANVKKSFEKQYHEIKDQLGDICVEHTVSDQAHKVLNPEYSLIIADHKNRSFFTCHFNNGFKANLSELVKAQCPGTPILLINTSGDLLEKWYRDSVKDVVEYKELPEAMRRYI